MKSDAMQPHNFQINLTNPYHPYYGYITLDGEKVYYIDDANAFYEALGYTEDLKHAGFPPEEYLWHEYRKDNCNKSYVCLQLKIIEYLSKYSETFKDEYAEACDYWAERCKNRKSAESIMCSICNRGESQTSNSSAFLS